MVSVSVVMSVYNGDRFLEDALTSILGQSFPDFELIVVNDGSSDNTARIVRSYSDGRIRFFSNPRKIGLTKSLNFAIRAAEGKYIARMDADDISEQNRLKLQHDYMEENIDIALLGTWVRIIDENGKIFSEWKRPVTDEGIKFACFYHNPMIHSSLFFRKKNFLEIGSYNENYIYSQDFEMIVRMGKIYKVANLPEFCVRLRKHKESIGTKFQHEQKSYAEKIKAKLVAEHIDLSPEKITLFIKTIEGKRLSVIEKIKFWIINRRILKSFLLHHSLTTEVSKVYKDVNTKCLKLFNK